LVVSSERANSRVADNTTEKRRVKNSFIVIDYLQLVLAEKQQAHSSAGHGLELMLLLDLVLVLDRGGANVEVEAQAGSLSTPSPD
jgi:hypothetical protein